MADLTTLLNGDAANILNFIAAAGALGTAAYGVVDAGKAIRGGISNAGFASIRAALEPLLEPVAPAKVFGTKDVFATLYANWLNGVAKADQKAIAKSLIRLGLTPATAPHFAAQTGVDAAKLVALATKIQAGEQLLEDEINVLGRFDAIVSAVLDEAYERADQQYRNACKLASMLVATLLAVVGGDVAFVASGGTAWGYLGTVGFWMAAFVGVISTPLAPVAKDLSTALTAAVKAVGFARR